MKCNICLERCEVTVLVSSSSRSVYMYIELCVVSLTQGRSVHCGLLLIESVSDRTRRAEAHAEARGGLTLGEEVSTGSRRRAPRGAGHGDTSRSSPCLSGF